MSNLRKILFVSRDDGGCSFYRCHQPSKFLKRSGLFDSEVVFRTPSPDQLMSADLVVMQEMGTVNASNLARFMIENRIPYLTEFDDFVHHVSPRNQGGYGCWNPSTLYVHRSMELARSGFGIQVSTPQLAREYHVYNPTVHVIPNWLDKDLWDQPASRKADGKIRIGWAGGNAHADDLAMISKVLERVLIEHKGDVVFETFGMTAQELHGSFPFQASPTGGCEKCGHEGMMHHYPGEPLQTYPTALLSKSWDIALAPVVNNAFGNCKSDIKIKEYSACGFPVIASPVQPYRDASRAGAPLVFAETFEEWYDALKNLIRSETERRQRSNDARKWSEKNWIQDRISETGIVYKEIIDLSEQVLGKKSDRIIKP